MGENDVAKLPEYNRLIKDSPEEYILLITLIQILSFM